MRKQISKERSNIIWILGAFIIMGLCYILINDAGIRLLSGTRAYSSGQNQWVKAQKQAALALVKFIQYEDEANLAEFYEFLDVIDGDRQGREMIDAEPPDYDLSYEGFLRGKNHPEDIPHLIWVYRYFGDFKPFEEAVGYWLEGEGLVNDLRAIAEDVIHLRQDEEISQSIKTDFISRLTEIDNELSVLEDNFTSAINEAGHQVTNLVYWLTLAIGLILMVIAAAVTLYQIKKIKSWNEKLRSTDRKFRNVLENSRDVIYQMNLNTGKYEYMSPSAESMIGYSADEIMEGGLEMMLKLTHPEDLDRMLKELTDLEKLEPGKTEITDTEFRIRSKSGEYIWVNNKRCVVKTIENAELSIIGNVRDITERKKYLNALDKSLREKEMLLSEIHHRVKNNLSIVSSLVELQKGSVKEADEEAFQEIQTRIKSIALVHEKLYQTETLAEVDLAEYIHDLTQMISSTYSTDGLRVTIDDEKMESHVVNIKKAVPLGLICSELLNNCYKYAFEGRSEGKITVTLIRRDKKLILTIADDGVGLPEDFEVKKQSSLGMTLLKALTKQVKGELEYKSGTGASFTMSFPFYESKGNGAAV